MNTTQMWAKKSGFTLLELLIVITILAILTLVVVLFINPVEMLKKSRDVQRMSDMATLNSAVNLFLQDHATSTLSYWGDLAPTTTPVDGPNARVKVSTPAGTSGMSVVYGSSSTPTLSDSTGWIKIDFGSVLSGPPISKLPIDPINASSTAPNFYRYAFKANNTFEIDATLESDAYGTGSADDNKSAKDGGNNATRYEAGTDLKILGTL